MESINHDLNALADDLIRSVGDAEASALLDEIALEYIQNNLPQYTDDTIYPWEIY